MYARGRGIGDSERTLHGLEGIVADGQPPDRETVARFFPQDNLQQIATRHLIMMHEYQHENTRLFFLIAPSVSLDGAWELTDALENYRLHYQACNQ